MSPSPSLGGDVVIHGSNSTEQHVFAVVYPNIQTSIAVVVLQLLGSSLIAVFFTQRVRLEDFKSLHGLRQISLPRLYLALLFLFSWVFFVTTGILVHAVGIDLNIESCETGILTCITLYSISKVFVYLFLGERVHIVWCPTLITPRYRSPLYLLSMACVLAYTGVVCHLYFVRIATTRKMGICVIGLELNGVIMLIAFDIITSVMMTFLFIWPLVRNTFHRSHLRYIAHRSVIAAFIALSTSCLNISILAAMGGHQFGIICLACWEGDVLISAITFFWLTSGSGLRPISSLVEEAKARSDSPAHSHSDGHSSRKRTHTWLRRSVTNSTISSFVGSGVSTLLSSDKRQSSLPTIMTHGLVSDSDSAVPKFEPPLAAVAVPDSVVVVERWPVLTPRPSSDRAPASVISSTVVPSDRDADSMRSGRSHADLTDGSSHLEDVRSTYHLPHYLPKEGRSYGDAGRED